MEGEKRSELEPPVKRVVHPSRIGISRCIEATLAKRAVGSRFAVGVFVPDVTKQRGPGFR